MGKITRFAMLGLLASVIGLGTAGCAWGPLKTGAPHIDKALAAIHEAGYPSRGREPSQYGKAVDGLPARSRNSNR